MATALNKIERAHQMYQERQHEDALGLYTEALAMAKTRAQKIALHSNRAACYLKLHDFKKAAEECTSVLELDHQHTGALMLRVQTLVTLKDYQSALFDVNRLMELNPSSDVYRNLQARLRTQLSLAPIPESEEEAWYLDGDEPSPLTRDAKSESPRSNPEVPVTQTRNLGVHADMPPKHTGWEAIPKPKGHSGLDYSRWDWVVDDSSEEEEEDAEERNRWCTACEVNKLLSEVQMKMYGYLRKGCHEHDRSWPVYLICLLIQGVSSTCPEVTD